MGHSKINDQIKNKLYTWITRHPQVVQPPIFNDCLKVMYDDQIEPQMVPIFSLQVSVREPHNSLVSDPITFLQLAAAATSTIPATCLSYRHCAKPRCSTLHISGGWGGGWGGWGGKEWGGTQHNRGEETWRSDVTVQVSPRWRTSGRHENSLPFAGRVLVHVQLYGECDREGGEVKDRKTTRSILLGLVSSRGHCLLPGRPLSPTPTSKYYQQHSQGARSQAPGRPVRQSWGRPFRHWLEPIRGRQPVNVHCRQRYGKPRHWS